MAELISTMEAGALKGCTRHTILAAIRRGAINGVKAGRSYVVRANKRFEAWQPDPRRQQIGRESQKPKKATRKRKG